MDEKPRIVEIRRPAKPPEGAGGKEAGNGSGQQNARPAVFTAQRPEAPAAHPAEESEIPPERKPEAQPTSEPAPAEKPVEPAEPAKPAEQAKEPDDAGEAKPTARPKPFVPPTDGPSALEQSILDEVKKRGELADGEEEALKERRKAVEEKLFPIVGTEEKKAEDKEGDEPAKAMEVAPEGMAKPRVVERRPIGGGVIVNGRNAGQSELDRRKREQASRDVIPESPEPDRPLTAQEKEAAAENARRIWMKKQEENNLFTRLKRMLGMAPKPPENEGLQA